MSLGCSVRLHRRSFSLLSRRRASCSLGGSGQGEGRCPTHWRLKMRRDRRCRCCRISVATVSPPRESLANMPTMSGRVNDAGSRKQRDRGTGALPRNAVGPDKCSCLCVHTEFQESSPRLPAAMVLLLVSITVLHLVTLAMLLIATLEKVRRFLGLCEGPHPLHTHAHSPSTPTPTPTPPPHIGLTLIRPSSAVFVFSLWLCSPGGSGLILKSLTSGTTASTTTPQTPGCARPPVRTVNH